MPSANPNRRLVYCPSCGAHLSIPTATRIGRKLRCGVCDWRFAVPPPPRRKMTQRTGVAEIDLDELPPEIRELMNMDRESNRARAPRPPPEQPEPAPRPRRFNRREELEVRRRAFDLDKVGRIRPRTGVCMLDTSEMELPFDD